MKFIYTLFSRIKHHLFIHYIIFLLFFIGVFTCSITFIFFYGNFTSNRTFVLENKDMFKSYYIDVEENSFLDMETLTWIENQGYDDVIVRADVEIVIPKDLRRKDLDDNTFSNNIMTIEASKNDLYSYNIDQGRCNFNEDEKNGMNVVVFQSLRRIETNNLNEKSQVSINDKAYTIIGMNVYDYSVIPYKNFFDNGYKIKSIEVKLPKVLSEEENIEFIANLQKNLNSCKVTSPYIKYANYLMATRSNGFSLLFFMCIVVGLCFITFMFLMKYIYDESRYENIVFSLSGASKSTVVFLMIIETLAMTFIGILSAILVHVLFYKTLFVKLNIYPEIIYTLKDYLFIIFLICLVTLLCSLPFTLGFWNNSAITSKNKYKT